jgi:hypothetical protein
MTVTGRLQRAASGWTVTDASGKVFQLSGVEFPQRTEGLTVRVVGEAEDSFGLGVLHEETVLRVQRWTTA